MSHLATILQLQQALSGLRETERRLAGIPDWMRELHQEHGARREEIRALEQASDEAAQQRRRAEGAIQDAQAKLHNYQKQVGLVRTQREYAALLQEIDTVKRRIKELEEEAFSALEAHDRTLEQLEAQQADFERLDERHRLELDRWEQEKPAVARRADELRLTVDDLRAELPRSVLALFDRLIEHRDGEAIAPACRTRSSSGDHLWHCGACHYQVRLPVIAAIRSRGDIAQCDGCNRILYLEEDSVV